MNDVNDGSKVEPLKKITLSLEAGTTPVDMDLTSTPQSLEFIFGVGAGGLTPFEYALVGKSEGDEASLQLKPDEICSLPGRTFAPLFQNLQGGGSLYVKATILRVLPADNREVIQAMAGSTGCGGGCDGSCGGHGISE
ncbi:MAG: hypothetical protein GY859_26685 [Desulfobacterales bacterium]|nr:hypothetical protein [Desulfobacterales bacterium]